jgi:hypothetical protein
MSIRTYSILFLSITDIYSHSKSKLIDPSLAAIVVMNLPQVFKLFKDLGQDQSSHAKHQFTICFSLFQTSHTFSISDFINAEIVILFIFYFFR